MFLECCHYPQWLSLHCGKKDVLLMTGLLIIFRTTFSSCCWHISKKSSRIDGRFCISHWGCVFKLLGFESQGKCVLSQVILLADFPGTSKATVGLGIHSLVYGFVFFHPTSLAGLAQGPHSALAVPHSWPPAPPSGPDLRQENHEAEPTSSTASGGSLSKGLLLSLAPCTILLRGPSRRQTPAKAVSPARQTLLPLVPSL